MGVTLLVFLNKTDIHGGMSVDEVRKVCVLIYLYILNTGSELLT